MSMEGLSIYVDVSPVGQVCILLWPNIVGDQGEGEKGGSQEKRMEECSKSALCDVDPVLAGF